MRIYICIFREKERERERESERARERERESGGWFLRYDKSVFVLTEYLRMSLCTHIHFHHCPHSVGQAVPKRQTRDGLTKTLSGCFRVVRFLV